MVHVSGKGHLLSVLSMGTCIAQQSAEILSECNIAGRKTAVIIVKIKLKVKFFYWIVKSVTSLQLDYLKYLVVKIAPVLSAAT